MENITISSDANPTQVPNNGGDNGGGQTKNQGQVEEIEQIIGKTRGTIWEHYIRFKQNDEIMAKCKYCGQVLKVDSGKNETSGLKNHIARCKLYPPNIQLKEKKQSLLNFPLSSSINEEGQDLEGESTNSVWKFDQELIRRAISFMIIVDELPFSHVENVGFKYLMSVACPKLNVPSRTTITRDCLKRFLEEKLKLKAYFKNTSQRVSLTIDTWISIQRINYMVLTAHYVDDKWNLQKKIVNFVPITSHKGEDIGMSVENCLREWGIDKIFTITVDNASSNDVAISYLKTQLKNWGHSICDNKFLHVRCVAHIVNLVVCDGLKDASPSISRVRSLVRWVRQSPSRIKKFKECVEIEKIEKNTSLILDVSTRWNSTYFMLNVAIDFERAFNRLASKDPLFKLEIESGDGWPTIEDWGIVRKLVIFLKYFFDITVKVSGTSYMTSNSFIHEFLDLDDALNGLLDETDDGMREMTLRIRVKLDKYWGNIEKMTKLLYIAVVLDPRYKFAFVEFAFNLMHGSGSEIANKMIKSVRDAIGELFKCYSIKYASQSAQSSQSQSEPSNVCSESIFGVHRRERTRRRMMEKFVEHIADVQGGDNTELDKYLSEHVDQATSCYNVLGWWKNNSARFPILSQMARDVLAVPMSTVAFESAFSTGGRVLDPFRSSLTPTMVQALICVQDWLRPSKQLMSAEENLDALETIEKEFAKVLDMNGGI